MVASRCGGYSVQLAMEHLSTMTLLPRSAVLVVLSVLLAACSEEPPVDKTVPETVAESTPTVPPEPKAPPMREVTKASTPPPSLEPWLRAHLPPDALAYVRIPSFWGMLGTPKGSMYDRALGSAPYVEAVENIREGFGGKRTARITRRQPVPASATDPSCALSLGGGGNSTSYG